MHNDSTLELDDNDHALLRSYLQQHCQHINQGGTFRLTREFCEAAVGQMEKFIGDCYHIADC